MAQLRWPAAGAFLGNAVWAFYTQLAGLGAPSVLIIGWTLLCLLVAYRRLADWQPHFTPAERWCAVLPLSALAAWLTVATTVNIAASLRSHGIDAGDDAPAISALIVLVAGAIAGAALLRGRGNPPYALVLIWALTAIYAAGGSRASSVAVAAVGAGCLVLGGAIIGWRRSGRGRWIGAAPGHA